MISNNKHFIYTYSGKTNAEETMKRKVVIILIISLAMIISCTGCESEIGSTIDLTGNDQILTSYLWVKDLDGEEDSYLAFEAAPMAAAENRFTMSIYENEGSPQSMMGLIIRDPDGSLTATFGGNSYSIRISSSESEVVTLSLTEVSEDPQILYFSPVDPF